MRGGIMGGAIQRIAIFTRETAENDYGVRFRDNGGEIDEAATKQVRGQLAQTAKIGN
jgi:hypothetical protein